MAFVSAAESVLTALHMHTDRHIGGNFYNHIIIVNYCRVLCSVMDAFRNSASMLFN